MLIVVASNLSPFPPSLSLLLFPSLSSPPSLPLSLTELLNKEMGNKMPTPASANPSAPDENGIVTTKFAVGMTCEGCANACKRICGKIEGITEIDASVADKMLTIKAKEEVDPYDVLAKLQKWGEAANKTVALA